jgi:hypothetical protein
VTRDGETPRRFYGGAVASLLRRGWKPTKEELMVGNPPPQHDELTWQKTPHVFMKKPWEREGDPGYDGDPRSCCLCHFTKANPVHGSPPECSTHEREMAEWRAAGRCYPPPTPDYCTDLDCPRHGDDSAFLARRSLGDFAAWESDEERN